MKELISKYMAKNPIVTVVVLAALAAGWYFLGGNEGATAPSVTTTTLSSGSSSLVVNDVKIYDLDGKLAYQGDMDLTPVLARIERGERDSHDNDGSVFGNREKLLPIEDRGYYHEYVVRTPDMRGVGPQRLIIGEDGEVYYTPDHYESFIKVVE